MTSLTIKDFDTAMNLGATNKGAVSKLVKAWEAKNDQRVKRAAGLGLMAVSLAACGGEDDDVVAAFNAATTAYNTAATAATTAATAAAAAQAAADALEDAAGDLTAAEAYEDAASAALTAAQAAQTAAADAAAKAALLVTAAAATDSTTDDSVGTAATVATAALTAAATNMVTAATAEVASAASAVALFSTPVAVALTALQDIADDLTAGNDTVTAIVSTALTTIGATDFVIDDSSVDNDTLTVTSNGDAFIFGTVVGIENIIVNVTDFGAAGVITATNVASGTLTINNLQIAGTTDAAVADAGGITVVAGSGVTGTLTVTEAGNASTVVDAGGAATVVINATAVVGSVLVPTVDFIANGDVALTVNAATVALNIDATEASVVTLTPGAGLLTITGDANTTLAGATSIADFTLDAISGFAGVQGSDGIADLTGVTSPITITAGTTGTTGLTLAANASVTTLDTGAITLTAANDLNALVVTSQTANLTLGVDVADVATANSAGGDTINVLNLTAGVAQTSLDITTAAATAINLSGASNVTVDAAGSAYFLGSSLNASAMTGNLTATAAANLLSITGGLGDDRITGVTGGAFVLAGGAGNDTLVAAGTMSSGSYSGFEILEVGAATTFSASQLSGSTLVVDGTAAAAITVTVNSASIDLSGLQFADALITTDIDATVIDPALFLNTQTFTITGSAAVDDITGSANADTINGGAGADILGGGAGADVINGGAGIDAITGGAGADILTGGSDTGDDFIFATGDTGITVATADTITDFTTGVDEISTSKLANNATIADGTALAAVGGDGGLAAFTTAANLVLTAGAGVDDVYVAWNVAGSGNAWVAVDENDSGSFDAGDTFIILSGINLATEILATDFN